jgi:hypothetical protein
MEPKALGPSGDRTEVKDVKASTIIMSLCAQGALQHILLLGTAREQWEALEALYAPLGMQQLSAKIQAFTSYKPPERGATVAVVATELSTLQYEIGTIDPTEKPSETLKISILFGAIRALDERFAPLILQLEISGTTTNYSAIVARFSEHERRMGPKEALKESVLLAKTGGKSPKKAFQGKCFNCGKQGHKKSDCKSKKVEKQEKQEKSPSTGPLATPGGGRGLSPGPGKSTEKPIANASSAETSWIALAEPTYSKDLLWVIDSGSSRHMTYLREAFTEYRVLDTPILVTTANGAQIPAIAEGTVLLQVALGASVRTVKLTGVLYVPKLAGSLISVLQLQDKGITVRTTTGSTGKKLLIELQGTVVGVASRLGRAYTLDNVPQGTNLGHSSLKATTAPENQASNHL